MAEDILEYRDHPDYADGYEAAWHNRGTLTGSMAYLAGRRAALAARKMFEEAGFIRLPSGIYSLNMQLTMTDAEE